MHAIVRAISVTIYAKIGRLSRQITPFCTLLSQWQHSPLDSPNFKLYVCKLLRSSESGATEVVFWAYFRGAFHGLAKVGQNLKLSNERSAKLPVCKLCWMFHIGISNIFFNLLMPLSLYFFILTLHVDTMSHWKVKMFPLFPNPKLMKFVFPHEIEKKVKSSKYSVKD